MTKHVEPEWKRVNLAGKVIHKGLLGENGQATALCFNPPRPIETTADDADRYILSAWLHDEITCKKCLKKMGLPDEISRGKLLRDNLESRLFIAFQFIDANYWNRKVRKPDEAKINPDPDGFLAKSFLKLTREFDELMEPVKTMMETHSNIYNQDYKPIEWEN